MIFLCFKNVITLYFVTLYEYTCSNVKYDFSSLTAIKKYLRNLKLETRKIVSQIFLTPV